MTARITKACCISLLALCCLAPKAAHALIGDVDDSFGLDGNIKAFTFLSKNHEHPIFNADNAYDAQGLLHLRLIAAGKPTSNLSYEIHGLTQMAVIDDTDLSAIFATNTSTQHYLFFNNNWEIYAEDKVSALQSLERANLKLRLEAADIILGKQAITFGKTYFWNPLDVFSPFGAIQFDREYKAAIDGLRVDIPLGDFSGLNLVATTDEFDKAYGLLRYFGNVADWDLALQGGLIHNGVHLGAGASGEIDSVGMRLEGTYLWPDKSSALKAHFSAVLGLGYVINENTQVQFEQLYNGGAPNNLLMGLTLFSAGDLLQASEHVSGCSLSHQISALVQSSLTLLWTWEKPSALLYPSLVISLSDEIDLLTGAMVSMGEKASGNDLLDINIGSEFGNYPHSFYMQLKAYF